MALTPQELIWAAKLSNAEQQNLLALGLRQMHADHVAGWHADAPARTCNLCSLVAANAVTK